MKLVICISVLCLAVTTQAFVAGLSAAAEENDLYKRFFEEADDAEKRSDESPAEDDTADMLKRFVESLGETDEEEEKRELSADDGADDRADMLKRFAEAVESLGETDEEQDKRELPRRPMDPPMKRDDDVKSELTNEKREFDEKVAAFKRHPNNGDFLAHFKRNAEQASHANVYKRNADTAAHMANFKRNADTVASLYAMKRSLNDVISSAKRSYEEELQEAKREPDVVDKRGELTAEEILAGVAKRGLIKCRNLGQSCSGTVFSPCCKDYRCHKPKIFKSGVCMKCKLPGSYCIRSKECCPGFRCSGLKCKI